MPSSLHQLLALLSPAILQSLAIDLGLADAALPAAAALVLPRLAACPTTLDLHAAQLPAALPSALRQLTGLEHLGLRPVGGSPTPNGTFDAVSSLASLAGLVPESEGSLPDRRQLTALQRSRFLALRSSNAGDAPPLLPAPADFPAGLLCCTSNCVRRAANFQLGSVRFGAA